MKKRNYLMSVTIVLLSMILFATFGCKKSDESTVQDAVSTRILPASLFLAEAPSGIVSISLLKVSAQEGDIVTVKAVVGGRKQAFVANRAVMTVVDASLNNPCLSEDDHCPTPWDYCCTPSEQLLPQIASVQIVDSDNRPLSIDLKTVDNFKPLSTLVIQGSVGPRPDDSTLVINATGIFVEQQKG